MSNEAGRELLAILHNCSGNGCTAAAMMTSTTPPSFHSSSSSKRIPRKFSPTTPQSSSPPNYFQYGNLNYNQGRPSHFYPVGGAAGNRMANGKNVLLASPPTTSVCSTMTTTPRWLRDPPVQYHLRNKYSTTDTSKNLPLNGKDILSAVLSNKNYMNDGEAIHPNYKENLINYQEPHHGKLTRYGTHSAHHFYTNVVEKFGLLDDNYDNRRYLQERNFSTSPVKYDDYSHFYSFDDFVVPKKKRFIRTYDRYFLLKMAECDDAKKMPPALELKLQEFPAIRRTRYPHHNPHHYDPNIHKYSLGPTQLWDSELQQWVVMSHK